jgi:hypothetical protein
MFYHTRSIGPDMEALKAGFKKCGELAQRHGYTQLGLATPTKGNLDGVISDLIGEEAVKILQRDNILDLKGITIHLITKRVSPSHKFSGPVLAVYTPIDQIKSLAKSHFCKGLIYVPWTQDEGPKFQKLFPSEVIYEGEYDLPL